MVEMNCFLCLHCHPNNDARIEALHAGEFGWANTATLLGHGHRRAKVTMNGSGTRKPLTKNDEVKAEYITIQDPTNENCGQCHGLVHVDAQTPLVMDSCHA